MKKTTEKNKNTLTAVTEFTVRFSEVDLMGIVWHGNYVKYFEDGREAFGKEYDLHYLDDVYKNGLMTPIVSLECDFRTPLKYGDKGIVETKYIDVDAAKICFEYNIYDITRKRLIVTGKSTQVFLNLEGELLITMPQFFVNWKKKWNIFK